MGPSARDAATARARTCDAAAARPPRTYDAAAARPPRRRRAAVGPARASGRRRRLAALLVALPLRCADAQGAEQGATPWGVRDGDEWFTRHCRKDELRECKRAYEVCVRAAPAGEGYSEAVCECSDEYYGVCSRRAGCASALMTQCVDEMAKWKCESSVRGGAATRLRDAVFSVRCVGRAWSSERPVRSAGRRRGVAATRRLRLSARQPRRRRDSLVALHRAVPAQVCGSNCVDQGNGVIPPGSHIVPVNNFGANALRFSVCFRTLNARSLNRFGMVVQERCQPHDFHLCPYWVPPTTFTAIALPRNASYRRGVEV